MTQPPSVFAQFCAAGLWPGVGPAVSERLAEAGIDRAEAVTEAALAELPTVTEKRARRLYSAWIAAAPLYELATILIPRGLPARWAWRLSDALGDAASAALIADPWQLLVLAEVTVADADSFARSIQPDVRPDDPRRTRALVDWALRRQARDGHTAEPIALLAEQLRPYGIGGGAGAAAVDAAVGAAVDAGLARRVPCPDGTVEPWVASETLAAAEEAIARHLARLTDAAEPLDAGPTDDGAGLDATQLGAVRAAARHGVSILTGGPGTGKSRTVTAVVRLARALGVTVVLAAPTGRAAKRLAELLAAAGIVEAETAAAGIAEAGGAESRRAEIGAADGGDAESATDGARGGERAASPDSEYDDVSAEAEPVGAMTIHRLLGARPANGGRGSTFEFDETSPIDAGIVVVDEASMVDVELAAALFAAIPSGAHLLIVGDPAQLPSIGPGRVLGDILDADAFPTTELTTLYRQTAGGAIARLATAVRGGSLLPPDPDDREVVIVPADGAQVVKRRVVQLVTDSIPRVFGIPADQIQVITPIHAGDAGTRALNQALKTIMNPTPKRGGSGVRGFDIGDRVVATANHFEAEPTGYANGEVGTVIDAGGKSLLVAFPGGDAEIRGKALGDLLHGWAVTVHRAQGSEWEAVVVVLPAQAGRMLSRPLVYTALTRARRHLSVVHAAGPLLAQAVKHLGATPRRTRLVSLLTARDGQRCDRSQDRAD